MYRRDVAEHGGTRRDAVTRDAVNARVQMPYRELAELTLQAQPATASNKEVLGHCKHFAYPQNRTSLELQRRYQDDLTALLLPYCINCPRRALNWLSKNFSATALTLRRFQEDA